MASFDKYSNYTKETSFSSVVFGSDKPVLEVELNEMQQIFNSKIGKILKIIGTRALFLVKPTYNASQKKFTLNNTIAIAGDYLVEIDTATVTYSATNKQIYLKLEEIEVNSSTELHAYGNTGGVVIANSIKDSRMPGETTRRKCFVYTLEAGTEVPTDTETVKYVSIALASSDGSISYTDYLNQRKNGAVLNSKSIVAELSEIEKTLDGLFDGTKTVSNANKVGGKPASDFALAEDLKYKIMSQDELSTTISKIATVQDLLSQMENKSVLHAFTNVSPTWYPPNIPASGCVLTVIMYSTTRVSFHLTNIVDCTQTYIAGYNGTNFTGWYLTSQTSVVATASVEE